MKLLLGSTTAGPNFLGSKVTSRCPYSPVRWLDTWSFSKHTPRLWSSFRELCSCQDLEETKDSTSLLAPVASPISTYTGKEIRQGITVAKYTPKELLGSNPAPPTAPRQVLPDMLQVSQHRVLPHLFAICQQVLWGPPIYT